MKNEFQIYTPLTYCDERLKQLHHKVSHGTTFPKASRPGARVNRAALADAVIGLHSDSIESFREDNPEQYSIGLARQAFTLSFLEGTSPLDLRPQLDELTALGEDTSNPREYALGIVDIAVKYLIDSGIIEAQPHETKQKVKEEHFEVDLAPYVDVASLISRLLEEDRLSRTEAQILSVVLRREKSSLPLERQVQIINQALPHIKGRLRRTAAMQPHIGERLKDISFAKGAKYLGAILEQPAAMLTDDRVFVQFAQMELINDDMLTRRDASQKVLGSIGYALETMYPQDASE